MNKLLIHATTWINLKIIALGERNQKKKKSTYSLRHRAQFTDANMEGLDKTAFQALPALKSKLPFAASPGKSVGAAL